MTTITKQSVIAFYLEFVNNFLTIERMAEYYDMPFEDCKYLIELGKKYNDNRLKLSGTMKVIDVPKESILIGPYNI